MDKNIETLITTCVELGSARTLEALGISAGEISQRKAKAVYGKWFIESERMGRLHPCRTGAGKTATRWYRVADILARKAADCAEAELRF